MASKGGSFDGFDGDVVPQFYIAHDDGKKDFPITDTVIQYVHSSNYDMLTAPITTGAFHSKVLSTLSRHLNSTRTDYEQFPHLGSIDSGDGDNPETHLEPGQGFSQMLLTTSPWIDLDSPDPLIADISRQVLTLEVQYAGFCGAVNILIQGPHLGRGNDNDLAAYARAIQEALKHAPFAQMHIVMPMAEPSEDESVLHLAQHARSQYTKNIPLKHMANIDPLESWDAWHVVRSLCNYSNRLSLALTLPQQLPSTSLQSKWLSEPVRLLRLPASSFIKNNAGDIMLPQLLRDLLFRHMRSSIAPWLMLSNIGELPGMDSAIDGSKGSNWSLASSSDPTPSQAFQGTSARKVITHTSYVNYVRHLQSRQTPKDAIERFSAGYQDYLQSPLQPLADNLESMTYEVFEKDPIKYDWYERAIAAALRDWQAHGNPRSGRSNTVCIAVVGAGRGPLVTRALQASASTGVPIDCWALEKNQNAFALLQRHFHGKWNQRVNLARSDMRSWSGPFYYGNAATNEKVHYRVDILVSELLGSFADNELSPECLDGVQHLLAPSYGISIPSSYTAYLTPIAAPKIHADILSRRASGDSDAAQIPYVVMLHAIDYLATRLPPKHPDRAKNPTVATPRPDPIPIIHEAWDFRHPNNAVGSSKRSDASAHGNEHNRRFTKLEFRCRERGVCHGLAGYFETVLYDPGASGSQPTGAGSDEGRTPQQSQKSAKEAKVELSTNPLTIDQKSRDMISWFPIFFPLKTPLYVPDNALLTISMWRQTDGRKVWYEWLVESFVLLGTGQGGAVKRVRLETSELHSSFNNGCLM